MRSCGIGNSNTHRGGQTMTRAELNRLKKEMAEMGLTQREQESALAIISVLKPMPAQKRLNVIRRVQARLTEKDKEG